MKKRSLRDMAIREEMGTVKNLKQDIASVCARLSNIILITFPFALCWFGYYAKRIANPFYLRGSLLVVAMFAVLYVIFSRIYDAFELSFHQVSELICSQLLSLLFADGIMFLTLWLMMRRFPNIFPALAALAGQAFFAAVWSAVADKCYFALFSAKPSALIYDVHCKTADLIREYGLERKFDIRAVVNVNECLRDMDMLEGIEVLFLNDLQSHDRNIFLKYCMERDITAYVSPRVGDLLLSGARRRHMFHLSVLQAERYHPGLAYLFTKRLMDITFSMAAILLFFPIMAVTAAAIKIYDGGPVLYKQARLTQNGRRFNMLKFRSMRVDAEKDGVARLSTGNSDTRVTPVGRVIRRLRIDELPQLFCTFTGSMSLVGPRPERPELAEQYAAELPEFSLRLQAKAGLTGYAQVYGKYSTLPYNKLQMDLMYIAHPSIWEDFRIILATAKVLFMPESTAGMEDGAAPIADERDGNAEVESVVNGTQ